MTELEQKQVQDPCLTENRVINIFNKQLSARTFFPLTIGFNTEKGSLKLDSQTRHLYDVAVRESKLLSNN